MVGFKRTALHFYERYNPVKGGIGDKLEPTDVDPHELAMGIEVEMEHTKDKRIARDIALDHLRERKDYYSRLRRARL